MRPEYPAPPIPIYPFLLSPYLSASFISKVGILSLPRLLGLDHPRRARGPHLNLSRRFRTAVLDFGFLRGERATTIVVIAGAAYERRALHLLLEAMVAHARRVPVGDLLREDRVVGDFVPVDLRR